MVAPRGRPPQPLWIFSSPSVACRIFRRLASRLARSFPRTSPNGRSPGAPGAPGARLGRVRRASQNRRPSAPSERPASRATSSEVLRHVPDPPGTRPGPARSAPRGASGVSAGASKTARSLGAPNRASAPKPIPSRTPGKTCTAVHFSHTRQHTRQLDLLGRLWESCTRAAPRTPPPPSLLVVFGLVVGPPLPLPRSTGSFAFTYRDPLVIPPC